jgi:Peptidase family M49
MGVQRMCTGKSPGGRAREGRGGIHCERLKRSLAPAPTGEHPKFEYNFCLMPSSRNDRSNVPSVDQSKRASIANLLGRYAPVHLAPPVEHLSLADRAALARLVDAGRWIDRIFWKQHSRRGESFAEVANDSTDRWPTDLKRLLRLNFGPWDGFDSDRPFWGNEPRPSGGSLYPPDLTRAQLEAYLERHSDERQALLSRTTLIEESAGKLSAIPYSDAYRHELAHIERCLVEASETATHEGFRHFLRARAKGLRTGALGESELLWIEGLQDSPIDVAIGPYEVYDDDRMGLKAGYESTVLVRHSTRTLDQLEVIAPEVERLMPGAMTSPRARQRVVVGVYDVVHTAGLTNMGGKAIAASLPNDEDIRTQVGSKLLLFRNVIAAKFGPIVKPLAKRILQPSQLEYVRESAFLEHTLLHETAHALSTCFVWHQGVATSNTINEALGDHYSTIDECRADLVAMVYLEILTQRGVFPSDMHSAAPVTFVANLLRSLRFGVSDAYSQASAITLTYLLRGGGVVPDSRGKLAVNVEDAHRCIRELAIRVQDIATRGDYAAAGKLIGELAVTTPEVQRLVEHLDAIPIDLEFVFEGSFLF